MTIQPTLSTHPCAADDFSANLRGSRLRRVGLVFVCIGKVIEAVRALDYHHVG